MYTCTCSMGLDIICYNCLSSVELFPLYFIFSLFHVVMFHFISCYYFISFVMLHFNILLLHRTLFEHQYTQHQIVVMLCGWGSFLKLIWRQRNTFPNGYYRGCVYSSTQTNITITTHHLFLTKFQISFYGIIICAQYIYILLFQYI